MDEWRELIRYVSKQKGPGWLLMNNTIAFNLFRKKYAQAEKSLRFVNKKTWPLRRFYILIIRYALPFHDTFYFCFFFFTLHSDLLTSNYLLLLISESFFLLNEKILKKKTKQNVT